MFKIICILIFKWIEIFNLKDGFKVYIEIMYDDGWIVILKVIWVFLSEIKIKVKKWNGYVCVKNKIFRDWWFNVIFVEVFIVVFLM